MKVALASDLHIEFGPISLENTDNADVLILSGDICVAYDVDSDKVQLFFKECCERFPFVVYIMGNHEHYHGTFTQTVPLLKSKLSHLENLHILDNECLKVNDVTFIGGTLWTDMNKGDPITLNQMTRMMNDFRIIMHGSNVVNYRDTEGEFHTRPAKFSPEDAVDEHNKMKDLIRTTVEGKHDEKFVVVGHHAPSKASIKPRYAGDHIMNGGYSSDLSDLILDNPQIKLWTHGHTHDEFDYMIGSTRVVCNPRGYIGHEACADNFTLKVFEV